MSRFLDFAVASLGFLTKVVSAPEGGGVTAGSTVSNPRVFFVIEVVAIFFWRITGSFFDEPLLFCTVLRPLKSTRNCPNANIRDPRFFENLRAGTGRRAGCQDIIDQHDSFSFE